MTVIAPTQTPAGGGRSGPRLLVVGAEWFGDRPGGLNRYLTNLAAALDADGADVRVIVLGPGRDAPPFMHPVSCVDAPLWRRLQVFYRAASALADDVDVVDVHFALYGLPVVFGPLRKKKLVVHFQGPWAAESAAAGAGRTVVAVKRAIERTVYRRADAVVVLSEAFGRIAADDYGVDADRIRVLPPGVDLQRFAPGDRATARSRFGADTAAFLAVCARRLERRMGIDVLLRAWADVQRQVPDTLLLVAGDGAARGELDVLRAQLPDPAGVRLLGRVPDDALADLYRAADCSVVPSRALEGFGLVVLESLACGTPPVVTDVGGLPNGVRGLDATLVVPSEDEAALAQRLAAAARGDLPERERCRAHAEEFGWARVANAQLDLAESLAAPAGGQTLVASPQPWRSLVTFGSPGAPTGAEFPATRLPPEPVEVRTRRLRVVFVDHCARLSGGELALARLLGALDVDAHVVLGEDGPLRQRLEKAGAVVHILPMAEGLRDLRRHRVGLPAARHAATLAAYVTQLTVLVRRLRPDLVHTNSLKAALYGGLAGRLAGVPVVWHLRDRVAPDYLPMGAVRLVRTLGRTLPSGLIANSISTLATLLPMAAIPSTGQHYRAVVGDPLVTPLPTAAIPSPVNVTEEPQVRSNGPLQVGIVGRLAPWKGQDLFLRAFARAFPGTADTAVIVGSALFGEHEYERSLKQLVTDLGLDGRVDMRGFCDDVDAELARLDVFVHASTIPEPFGQVVVEAMAAGLPVVVPDQGGPAEVVQDGVSGILYPMGDEEGLAEAMMLMAVNPELRARLGNAGHKAAERFRPEVVAQEVAALYQLVLARANGR